MGTNFYFGMTRDEAGVHIGKRSAAGLYCWDCGVSLCNKSKDTWSGKYFYGNDAIHYSNINDEKWLDCCPICGKKPTEESVENSTGGRELGFNKNKPQRKTGVATCSSFTWAVSPKRFKDLIKIALIYDEYGGFYTKKDFQAVLKECPIKFYEEIGNDFL